MHWHIIEGKEGCAFARDHGCITVVVDALRASCTAAMLLEAGAEDLTLVPDVETALTMKHDNPDLVLAGERNGLPPGGFDLGNSPRNIPDLSGKSVAFTTSNGTALMLEAWGGQPLYMASITNGSELIQHVLPEERDVVLIPAGLSGDPTFSSQEDWVAAAAIVMLTQHPVGEGAIEFREWQHMMSLDGVGKLFQTAPHAQNLRDLGLEEDIAFCARPNLSKIVPKAIARTDDGILLKRA